MNLTKIIGLCSVTALFGCSSDVCIPVAKTHKAQSESNTEKNQDQKIYQIKEGDFLMKIAKENSVGLEDLLNANPKITNPSLIYPGQELIIPPSSTINKTPGRVLRRDFQGLEYIFNVTKYDFDNLPNPKVENFDNDDDVTLLARLIFGEARSESKEVKTLIGYSVLNRTGKHKWWGHTLREVILKPSQYTCFSQEDTNYPKIIDPINYEASSVWKECVETAHSVLSNPKRDMSNGATHYHTLTVNPSWSEGKTPVLRTSNTLFYHLEQ